MSLDTAVLNRAMELDAVDRAELARRLLLSLEPANLDEDADQAWATEIEARVLRAESEKQPLADWREAVECARASLNREKP